MNYIELVVIPNNPNFLVWFTAGNAFLLKRCELDLCLQPGYSLYYYISMLMYIYKIYVYDINRQLPETKT